MRKSYCGNIKPFATALYAWEDRETVLPILEAVSRSGKELCYDRPQTVKKTNLKRTSAVIVFVTDAFTGDRELQGAVLEARSMETPVIPVIMTPKGLPEVLRPFLAAANAIMTEAKPDSQAVAEKIQEAESMQMRTVTEAQADAMKRTTRSMTGAAVLVVVTALLLIIKPWTLISDEQVPTALPTVNGQDNAPEQEESDLQHIQVAVFAGDTILKAEGEEIIENLSEEGYWYSWATDGHGNPGARITKGTFSQKDFDIISEMTDLRTLVIVEQNITELPDLTYLTKLTKVVIWNTPIDDISALGVLKWSLKQLDLRQTRISDLSPLTNCVYLKEMYFRDNLREEECTLKELKGFEPQKLEKLSLHNCLALKNMTDDSFGSCVDLKNIELETMALSDLSIICHGKFVLETLCLSGMYNLSDLSCLNNFQKLKSVTLEDLPLIQDISFLRKCPSLQEFKARDCEKLSNVSALSGRDAISSITLENTGVRDMSFLEGRSRSRFLDLRVSGKIHDWSGLGYIDRFLTLELDPVDADINEVMSNLKSTTITTLILHNCFGLDMKQIPAGVLELELENADITTLEGIGHLEKLRKLVLKNDRWLTSLNGILDCGMLNGIMVDNCPRLVDLQALYEEKENRRNWDNFGWCNMQELPPDFGRMKFSESAKLKISGVPLLTDFTFLNGMPNGTNTEYSSYSFDFGGLDSIKDYSALIDRKGSKIVCPPQMPDEIVEKLKSGFYEVYREKSQGSENITKAGIRLASLEELTNLPEYLLKDITEFTLVGDKVLPEGKKWHAEKRNGEIRYLIDDPETGESMETIPGSLSDLSLIQKLTGLRKLELINQPLESLEGIQRCQSLQQLTICGCISLTDISQVFGIPSLEYIDASHTNIRSIQGIQNMTRLSLLHIDNTKVTDLSPLRECDLSFAIEKCGGLDLSVNNLSVSSIAPLSTVRKFKKLQADLDNWDRLKKTENWNSVLKDCEIFSVSIRIDSNEELAELLQQHPEIEELYLQGNKNITDLRPVLSMRTLRYIKVSSDMYEAISSIDGQFGGKIEREN